MMHYPYSDPSDRFADCRYPDDEPRLTRTICPICGERIEEHEDVVHVDDGNVTYHKECFEGDLWDLLEPFGVVLGEMPEEEEFYDAITEFCD